MPQGEVDDIGNVCGFEDKSAEVFDLFGSDFEIIYARKLKPFKFFRRVDFKIDVDTTFGNFAPDDQEGIKFTRFPLSIFTRSQDVREANDPHACVLKLALDITLDTGNSRIDNIKVRQKNAAFTRRERGRNGYGNARFLRGRQPNKVEEIGKKDHGSNDGKNRTDDNDQGMLFKAFQQLGEGFRKPEKI